MIELWICGQYFESKDQPLRCWEFQGVFESEDKAVAACATENFFIFPAVLNQALPTETTQMPAGVYYPRCETKEQAAKRLGLT